ncbi:MAG: phytanoyl-CoA dioxygenase family protein [Myxococcota bacterium]|nr:phytanoyl-CoA dioxygenase family protein [Myxococcota bacterium]
MSALVELAQVFGQGKSFRDNRFLGDARLNRLGLHAARFALAHACVAARRAQLAPFVDPAHRRAFDRDGFVRIEHFLAPACFERALREARSHRGEVRECIQGDTLTHRVLLDAAARRRWPALDEVTRDPRLRRLIAYAAGSTWPPLFYVQHILNRARRAPPDPQKHLHSDTFHPTVKAWLFLEDVPPGGGPLRYVPGSHRATLARLRWERARSLDAVSSRDSYSARGSLRLTEDDHAQLGYPPAVDFTVPANTLVIADTHGFHARGHAEAPSSRLELWAYVRPSPFSFVVTPPIPGTRRLQDEILKAWWRRQDERYAARGHQAPWHIAPSRL